MAKNFIEKGDVPEVPAPSGGVVSGEYFVVGALAGVAQTDALETIGVAMCRTGAFSLPKATGFVVAIGDVLYWDAADGNFNDDTANNAGAIALTAAGSGDTTFVGILVGAVFAGAVAAAARLDDLEALDQVMPAAGTQIALVANDTYVNYTADALTWGADVIEAGDVIDFQFVWLLDGMNAAMVTTFGVLLGALDLGTVALTTGDAADYAEIKGSIKFITVGASSTVDVALQKLGSDGGTETVTYTHVFAATGPATTSAVVLKARAKAATGNAANLTTQSIGWGHLRKAP